MDTLVSDEIQKLEIVGGGIAKLPLKDQEFARSLIVQYHHKGRLSEKQWYWIKKFADTIDKPPAPIQKNLFDDYSKIIELFNKAKEGKNGLKNPKIHLRLNGKKLVLKAASVTSRNAGSIYLSNGGGFENQIYYGRISKEGQYLPHNTSAGMQTLGVPLPVSAITKLLSDVAENPKEVLSKLGKETGICMLCGLTLTDPVSVQNGIGPICINRWL